MTTFDRFTPPEGVTLARRADVPEGWLILNASYDPNLDGWEWTPHNGRFPDLLVWVKRPPATIEIEADLAARLAHDSVDLAHWGKPNRTTIDERLALWEAINKARGNVYKARDNR